MEEKFLLKMDSIVKVFGSVKALDNVKLDVKKGEVHALCGENGAGKSTLMRIIAGALNYTKGKMEVEGEEVYFNSTKEAEKAGITMIYQEFNMINELSVAENMYLGRLPKNKLGLVDWKKLYKDSDELLKKLGLRFSSKDKIKNLSVSEIQMVEIARCLTIGTKLIIMDEPTAALTKEEIKILFSIISELKKKQISILYISHRMDEIFEISDRLTVFRDGKYITTKNIKETNYDEVVSLMVGKSIDKLYPTRNYKKEEAVLRVENIKGDGVFDVSFELGKGEILGIAGLLGSGTSELSKLIYGANIVKTGRIFIEEKEVKIKNPNIALKEGIGFVSEDRKREGLVLIRSIRENMSLSSLKKVSKYLHINKIKEKKLQEEMLEKLKIKSRDLYQEVGSLSGGNQQKVVFAKVLKANPKIIILNEPTRGVDVLAKAEIYQIMDELTKQGKSIILISTDLPEVIGMSDRIIIMKSGKIVMEVSKEEMSGEKILAHASGGVS